MFLVRTFQPDVMTTYNDFGGYGHPDHIRTHLVAVGAFARAGDPEWYPEQLAPEHGGTGAPVDEGGLAPWTPAKIYEQAIPASVRTAMAERMEALGEPSFWSPPEDATPEQLTEWETQSARMLVPDESITAWVDVADVLDQRWDAIKAHVTQISDETRSCASARTPGPSSGTRRRSSAARAGSRRPTRRPTCSRASRTRRRAPGGGGRAPAGGHDRGPVGLRRGRGAPAGVRRSRRRTSR